MSATRAENLLKTSNKDVLQERMWIEIINRMENLYAKLANRQEEIEKKNRELLKTKGFIENVLNHMACALIVLDSNGNIKMVNDAALTILGYKEEDLLGRPMELIFEKTDGKSLVIGCSYFEKLVKDGAINNFEIYFRSKEGERIPMVLSGSVTRNISGEIDDIISVARDLRDTKRMLAEKARAEAERAKADELEKAYNELQELKAQLIQSEKMASLGQLAAGIAHEINNPLTGVLTSGHILLKRCKPVDSNREDLEIIVNETTRCREIVRGLLDFARQSSPQMVTVDLTKLINKTLSIMENQFHIKNIKIIKKLKENIPEIMLDVNQIEQVFVNLLLNSIEAMPEGGTILIATEYDQYYIIITFQDTGQGIPENIIGKIFDPFFSTKSRKKGTGLGLSVSYGIIKKHNGTIEVKSKENEGTIFTIKLPIKQNIL